MKRAGQKRSTKSKPRAKPLRATTKEADDSNQYHARPRDLSANAINVGDVSASKSSSSKIFTPLSFAAPELGLDVRLANLLQRPTTEGGFGISSCTKAQSVTLANFRPSSALKRNVFLKSQTGSGKTLAYLLPVFQDLISTQALGSHGTDDKGSGTDEDEDEVDDDGEDGGKQQHQRLSRSDGTKALIIAPTRELCAQITQVLQKLCQAEVKIVCGCISGGEKKKSEKARLRKGVTVLVATPGRLLDHLKTTEAFNLNLLRWIIMDEADRLLDMGLSKI